MAEEKKSVFREVVEIKQTNGDLKQQVVIEVTPYDTSQMEGYKEGQKKYTGLTCQIKSSKFVGKPKINYVNFDPLNEDIEKAIKQMYNEVHKKR